MKYQGVFRQYQAKVLENVEKHNIDKKIHIVAAPGSGKTILGLELIRHFGQPALILSPSITIRQQWGERFGESFLSENEALEDYFSTDLRAPKLITCVTYQAMHTALNRITGAEEEIETEEADEPNPVQQLDFKDFSLFDVMKKSGFRTLCLDEAHHLRSEWQKSLEILIKKIEGESTIIALTATPPYDSTLTEWERYIAVCGEIDEEISTPQLVAQGTLCPHQDYVYFNYPTEKELGLLKKNEEKIEACIGEILESDLFERLIRDSKIHERSPKMDEVILDSPKGFIAFMVMVAASGHPMPKSLIKQVSPSGKLPDFTLERAETAFNFILENPILFSPADTEEIYKIIAKHGLIERKKARLVSGEKLNRMIISSVGKLESIADIAENEEKALGDGLRMLILTDFIKRDLIKSIGTDQPLESIGTVPIFETLRRKQGLTSHLGILSGSLVIVPQLILPDLKNLAAELEIGFTDHPIENTNHCELVFSGNNKQKVVLLTEAFQQGLIQILIGTKSLLGEGWDSPCINSVILASFIGTFMLSNQMRGRAIRIDPDHPDKTANIWHLVTIEPAKHLSENLFKKALAQLTLRPQQAEGIDYALMVRRFKTFYAPAYERDSIENGIERLSVIEPPFTPDNIARINAKMMAMANDRAALTRKWKGILKDNTIPEIIDVNEVPKKITPTSFLFVNLLNITMLGFLLQIFIRPILEMFLRSNDLPLFLAGILILILLTVYGGTLVSNIIRFLSPKRTIRVLGNSILSTLKDIGEVRSSKARFVLMSDKNEITIKCALIEATTYEKNIFAQAMSELLSSIDNPRYLLIRRRSVFGLRLPNYDQSFACPSILSAKRETVDLFTDALRLHSGVFTVQFTRSQEGRRILLKCRRHSYINRNDYFVKGKKVIKTKWE